MKRKIFNILGTAFVALSLGSCSLDINKDPYDVTELDIEQLLTAAEYEAGYTYGPGDYLNSNFSSYVHHTVSREIDNYSLVAGYSSLTNTWSKLYRYGIKNTDKLIEVGDAEGDSYYAGIGRVLRAYLYLGATDLWGDIPYSQANNPEFITPELDKSADIYNDLLKSLDTAIANFKDKEAANTHKPRANDLFYNGDVEKWIKAANTLKLRILVQSRLAKDEIEGWQSALSALVAEGNFIGDGEDLQFPHSSATTPSDERNQGYVDEYQGGQKGVWISPWLYETMNGLTWNFKDNPLRGISDPRRSYYWYNQSTAISAANNITDYRDGAFVSIMMGSNSGYTSSTQETAMTVLGIYPIGGKFDAGNGGAITAKDGSGCAPDKMLQAYSVPFMLAELVLAGEINGDAKKYLEDGIKASIAHVNAVTKLCDASAPLISSADAQTFVEKVSNEYEAASAEGKLEIVMTEKWIANFYNPIEAYNDIRRTGYPKLFKGDENNMAWTPYAQTIEATRGLSSFELVTILDYPRILWYPQNEIETNPNVSNSSRNVAVKTVFWDK